MRRIVAVEFMTLDGVMQGPGGPEEDTSGGFSQGGWLEGYADEISGNALQAGWDSAGTYLLGRRTYDIFAGFWPTGPEPLASMFNAAPKHVVSNSLREPLSWQGTSLISGAPDEVADQIRALKAEEVDGKDIQVIGSGVLVRSLLEHHLLDALRLLVHPLVLGQGKRLFAEGMVPATLQLANSVATTTGLLILDYEPVAAPLAGGGGLG